MVGGRLCVVKTRCDSDYARSFVQLQAGRGGNHTWGIRRQPTVGVKLPFIKQK